MPWWRYRRPGPAFEREPGLEDAPRPQEAGIEEATADAPSASAPPRAPAVSALPMPPAAPLFVGAGIVGGVTIALAQLGGNGPIARVLVAAFGLLLAAGLARFVQARHPEEPWIGKLIMWGMIVKLVGTAARYYVFVVATTRVPDALNYDRYGREFVEGTAKELDNLRKTNFLFFLTGHVYSLIGPDLIAAFFLFGIAAFLGAYFWYRAAADAVPSLNRMMFCALVFFAPSLAFWPSSVGKEAVMMLAMGLAALGVAGLLGGRLLQGLVTAAPGAWLMWVVRPHLLAFMTVAAGAAYLVGRGTGGKTPSASLKRPIGIAIMALLGVLAVSQATSFLGMKDFSIASVEQELSDTSAQTSQGGSRIDTGESGEAGQVHLTPLSIPQGLVTVVLRPFPWEVESSSQLIASLESVFFVYLIVRRRQSIVESIRRMRTSPFLLFCWILLAFFAVAYSSFGNMGLLVRQRSLALPVFFALLCVEPSRAGSDEDVRPAESRARTRAAG
jgi:hypothetical protein